MIDVGSLNPAQRRAVTHEKGPLLVLAGAGSGKTRVITMRIARLLKKGVHPRAIVALTFTNKAAREMRQRVRALVGPERSRGVTLSTFHSLCVRMLRADGHRIGLDNGFVILDTGDQSAQLVRCCRENGIDLGDTPPRAILSRLSVWKNQGLLAEDVKGVGASDDDPLGHRAALAYPAFAAHLKQLNAVDFDDLLLFTRQLLSEISDVKKRYQARFLHLMVDEYQDTNPIQLDLIRLLVGPHRNLCVVGDDDQAIYGFRGADVNNILGFEASFSPCKQVTLEDNYRSTQHILSAAHGVIQDNPGRRPKKLRSHRGQGLPSFLCPCPDGLEEARFVASKIRSLTTEKDFSPGDVALLYRANPQSRAFEEELRIAGVPYRVVGGQEFYQRKEVKDVIAYLTLIAHPSDELAFRRVVNLPARGIGATTVGRLVAWARAEGHSLLETCVHEDGVAPFKSGVKKALRTFAEPLLRAQGVLAHAVPRDPMALCAEAIADAGYGLAMRSTTGREEQARMKESLDEVLSAFAAWVERLADAAENPDLDESHLVNPDGNPLATFLDRLALDEEERNKEKEREKEEDKSPDRVTLMSLHASKGLEFPVVFLVGMEEGLLPHRRVLEESGEAGVVEERRLCYVGMTRAQTQLFMTRAQKRRRRNRIFDRAPSRFLGDIPESHAQVLNPWARLSEEDQAKEAADSFAALRSRLSTARDKDKTTPLV
jgi:superfamily I DNA/RNA helicase